MKKPEDYKVYHHVRVTEEDRNQRSSLVCIEVLQFLKGHPWNEIALAFVTALEPTAIRVTTDWITADSCCGRITIYVDESNNIKAIERECRVWLPEGAQHGYDLSASIHFKNRIDWKERQPAKKVVWQTRGLVRHNTWFDSEIVVGDNTFKLDGILAYPAGNIMKQEREYTLQLIEEAK